GVINADCVAREVVDFLLGEQLGQEQPAFAVEELDLLRSEFHDVASFSLFHAACAAAFSLSSARRPAVSACASAAFSAATASPAKIASAMVSCSLQTLSR